MVGLRQWGEKYLFGKGEAFSDAESASGKPCRKSSYVRARELLGPADTVVRKGR